MRGLCVTSGSSGGRSTAARDEMLRALAPLTHLRCTVRGRGLAMAITPSMLLRALCMSATQLVPTLGPIL